MRLIIADADLTFRVRLHPLLKRIGGGFTIEEVSSLDELPAIGAEASIILLSDALVGNSRRTLPKIRAEHPGAAVIVIGSDDVDRMRGSLRDGARGYVRRMHVNQELPSAIEYVTGGGNYVPPVIGMKESSEPVMTLGGPVPAGFFREDGLQQMTPRQREILRLMRDGHSNAEISKMINVSVGTVKIHVTAVFRALGVKNRTQARVAAEHLNLSDDPPSEK